MSRFGVRTVNLLKQLSPAANQVTSLRSVLPRSPELEPELQRVDALKKQYALENPLSIATSGFKHIKYVEGQEDAHYNPPDWEFFQEHIRDPRIVALYKEAYDKIMHEVAQRPVFDPEFFAQFEEFAKKVHSDQKRRIKLFLEQFDEQSLNEEAERFKWLKDNLDTVTKQEFLARMPEKYTDQLRSDWDNERWETKNDFP